jgi:hypothetical protein
MAANIGNLAKIEVVWGFIEVGSLNLITCAVMQLCGLDYHTYFTSYRSGFFIQKIAQIGTHIFTNPN